MKRFLKYWPAVILFAVLAIAFTGEAPSEEEFVAGSPIYEYAVSDTISDAENDVVTISPALISNWYYNWTLKTTVDSGTKNVILILEESNERTGSDNWYEVERDTATGAGTSTIRLFGSGLSDRVQGVRQRVTIDGSGTQETRYTVKATLKKDN